MESPATTLIYAQTSILQYKYNYKYIRGTKLGVRKGNNQEM